MPPKEFDVIKIRHVIALTILILSLLLAHFRQDKHPDVDLGNALLIVRVLEVRDLSDSLEFYAKVLESSIVDLQGKKVKVRLYGAQSIPSKTFELNGYVKIRNNRIYVNASYMDIVRIIPTSPSLRERIIERVEEKIEDEETQRLFKTFILGESMDILNLSTQANFYTTGLVHLLVVSGFHVGIVSLFLRFLLPGRYGLYIALLGVFLYSFFVVPTEPPVLRACLMIGMAIFIRLLYARHDNLSVLLFSASFILLLHPDMINSYSLWLSFFATLYIILSLKDIGVRNRYVLPFWVSAFAFLGSAPLISTFSLTTPSSIILTPLATIPLTLFGVYGFLDLLTFMSLPVFPLEVLAKLSLSMMEIFSQLSVYFNLPLSIKEAILVSVINALLLYLAKGYYKMLAFAVYLFILHF